MKILVIIIRYNQATNRATYNYQLPVGLAYILAVLKSNNYEVHVLNLNHCDGSVDDIIRKTFSEKKYDLVLTGGLSIHYAAIKSCIDSIRRYAPNSKIVLGGGIISSQPTIMFKALNPDYLVIGEGELTIVELIYCLCNRGDLGTIDGIGYRGHQSQLILNRPRDAIKDIDSIPWPDYDGLGFDEYLLHMRPSDLYYYDIFDFPRAYPLISSRSCPYSCTFCFHPIGKKYRQRTIANIIDEIKNAIRKYQINIISIYDELFSYNKNRVFEFCEQIKSLSGYLQHEIRWNCQMRVDNMDEDMVIAMKEAGCYIVSLGLESYSQIVLNSMNKKITPHDIDRTLEITRRHNMTIQGNFIFGDIAETIDTAMETLNYWKNNIYGGGVALGFITPYPGTSLYKHCIRSGIIKDELDFITNHMEKPLNMSDTMTEDQFEGLQLDIYEVLRTCSKYVVARKLKKDEIKVTCPYCNEIIVYMNYHIKGNLSYWTQDIVCRHCKMRFYLASFTYKLKLTLFQIVGAKNIFLIKKYLKNIINTIF